MTNITELLKDAPKGMKLYSPLFGEVEFAEVMDTSYMPIRVIKRGYGLRFDKYGRYMGNEYPDAECLLFPRKDYRTWNGWTPYDEPKFKVGDWIACDADSFTLSIKSVRDVNYYFHQGASLPIKDIDEHYHLWRIADAKDGDVLYSLDSKQPFIYKVRPQFSQAKGYCCINKFGDFAVWNTNKCIICTDKYIPATKEQRDLLFTKMREAGYEWDAYKKELRKIKPHYDIANFNPRQWVLVRQGDGCAWRLDIFSNLKEGTVSQFECVGNSMVQCIPYDGNENLLGTTNMPNEEYINW